MSNANNHLKHQLEDIHNAIYSQQELKNHLNQYIITKTSLTLNYGNHPDSAKGLVFNFNYINNNTFSFKNIDFPETTKHLPFYINAIKEDMFLQTVLNATNNWISNYYQLNQIHSGQTAMKDLIDFIVTDKLKYNIASILIDLTKHHKIARVEYHKEQYFFIDDHNQLIGQIHLILTTMFERENHKQEEDKPLIKEQVQKFIDAVYATDPKAIDNYLNDWSFHPNCAIMY
jgi:hypothetical protein